MGLSKVEELEAKCSELERLYNEAVKARDEAIEERNSATVVLAFQLEKETHELNQKIEQLTEENEKLFDENEDLAIKLEYARKDLKKLQKDHIKLQLETEQYISERDEAIQKVNELHNQTSVDLSTKNNKQFPNSAFDGKRNDNNLNSDTKCDNTDGCENKGGENKDVNKPASISVKRTGTKEDKGKSYKTMDEDELDPRPPIKLKTTSVENDYNVHEELGKGKFGVVKKVTHKSTGEVFAAKYIKTSISAAGSSRDDVLREIDIMGRLHHKRLVGLLDAYDIGKSIVMIMEFVSGGELFERVVDEDCLTEKEAAYYMQQMLQGLKHMHSKNILHLDLKPENIVCVSKDSWDIKLIDFGLAIELVPGTKLKAMKGTPEFMAPEAVNFETIDKPADMWSIGVIAYILLSGLSPFMGDDNNETLSNVNAAEWDFDDESFDIISDEAKEFISELLIKNPKKRNTVEDCINHKWMKKSASSDAVKLDTKKLKQFLAKRRWQIESNNDSSVDDSEKSVNALVAVRRLSSMTSLLGLNKARPSIAPLLAVLPASSEESEHEEEDNKTKGKKMDGKEKKENNVKGEIVGEESKNEKMAEKPVDTNTGSKEVKCDGNKEEPNDKQQEANSKPVFIKELEDFTVQEGDSVTLEVILKPECEIEWFFDGGEVNEREGISVTDHGDGRHTIVLNDCEEDDSGEYICIAVNEHGKARSRGFIIVEAEPESGPDIDPPSFTKELIDMSAKEGEKVTMEVTVNGEDYDVEWFKNAVDVVEGGRFSFVSNSDGRHALVITDVEDDDTGEYCCVATNDGGRATCAGYFTVHVEEEEDDEAVSEDETDEEMYQEQNVTLKNEFIEESYAIEEEIGRGRFGIVRKCVHIETGIHFVAKSIKTRPSQKQEFSREIDILNVLRHPNISRIRDAFERPREIVIVMEFNRGGDLLKRINEQPMSEPDSVSIMQQILEAVNYIHNMEYMHLDIKPENVMFKREGGNTVKLIDFSLSRKYDPKVETKISQGTAEYIAPEVVNYDSVCPATDMWAIGVCTYMMLSGKSPFLGETEADTFSNITHIRWSFTDEFNDVSDEAREYISKLLVKKKQDRMKASECLSHPWITKVGVKGNKERQLRPTLSSSRSLSDLSNSLLSNGDIHESISSVESYLRLNSATDDVFTEEAEPKQSVDAKELEATLQVFMLKLRDVESERAELEEKLSNEESRAYSLKQSNETLDEKISQLEKENSTLSSQIKSKNDLLVKVGDLETKTKRLEEQLEEKDKSQKMLEEKCGNLRTKLEQYDFLEEKLYRYEREKKVNLQKIQTLEEKLNEQTKLDRNVEKQNSKNEDEKSSKIKELIAEREEIESKYNNLRKEKDNLVSELTKKFTLMENETKENVEHVDSLENKIKELEKELQNRTDDLSESNKKLERSSKEVEKYKQRTSKELEAKVATLDEQKAELEKEGNKLKKQKEEAQKTCEELASKLSKAYSEMEKLKSSSILARDYDKLRRERDDTKRTLSSLEEKNAKLSRDLKSRDVQISDLQKDLELSEKEKRTLQERRKISQINTETNTESLKSTILDLESTILTHKSTIAVSKGEIELLQEKLSLEEDKNARYRDELMDKKRIIAKLKTEKAEVIAQYEDELDEALDCYEEGKKELIAKFEKRLKDVENEYSSTNHRSDEESTKFNEAEAIKVVELSIESLKTLSTLEENDDSFESGLLDILKRHIELMIKKVNNNLETEALQGVFHDLEDLTEKRLQRRKAMEETLENSTKERELITLRVNKMKKKYHDQSDALLDAKHNIEVLEGKVNETKERIAKQEQLEEENNVLKWRVNELSIMNQKLDEKIVDDQGEIHILERQLQHYKEKTKSLKELEEDNASLKSEICKLEKINMKKEEELSRESRKHLREVEEKLEKAEKALKYAENRSERLGKEKMERMRESEEERNSFKSEIRRLHKSNKELRDKMANTEEQIKLVETHLEQTKAELKTSDEEYENLFKKNEYQKEKLKSSKESLKSLEQMLESKQEAYERVQKESDEMKYSLNDTISAQTKQITDLTQQIDFLQKEKEELHEQLEKLHKELEETNFQLKQLQNELADKEQERARLDTEIQTLRNLVKDQNESFENLKSEMENLKEELDDKSKLKEQNKALKIQEEETCRLVDNLRNKKGQLENEISVLRKVSREQERKINVTKIEAETAEKELEDKIDSHGRLQLNIKQLTFRIDELETLCKQKSSQLDKMESETGELRRKDAKNNNEIDEVQADNKQLRQNLDKLNETIKELKQDLNKKDQDVVKLQKQYELKSERLTALTNNNKDLLADAIKSNRMIEEQRIQLTQKSDEFENLQRRIISFEVEKKNGLAMFEELQHQVEEKDDKIKSLQETKKQVSSLEETLDAMEIELNKVQCDLRRKNEDYDMLMEENACLTKDVEILRKERLEGYRMLSQLEKRHSQLKEELRQVKQALRIYKNEVSKLEEIKKKDNEIQSSTIKIRKLSEETIEENEEARFVPLESLEDPFDLPRTKLCKINEGHDVANNKAKTHKNVTVQTEDGTCEKQLVDGIVQTDKFPDKKTLDGSTQYEKHVNEKGVQTEKNRIDNQVKARYVQTQQHAIIDSAVQTQEEINENNFVSCFVQTEHDAYVNSFTQTEEQFNDKLWNFSNSYVQTDESTCEKHVTDDTSQTKSNELHGKDTGSVDVELQVDLKPEKHVIDNCIQTDQHHVTDCATQTEAKSLEQHVHSFSQTENRNETHHVDNGSETEKKTHEKNLVDKEVQWDQQLREHVDSSSQTCGQPSVTNGVQTDKSLVQDHGVQTVGIEDRKKFYSRHVQTEHQSNRKRFVDKVVQTFEHFSNEKHVEEKDSQTHTKHVVDNVMQTVEHFDGQQINYDLQTDTKTFVDSTIQTDEYVAIKNVSESVKTCAEPERVMANKVTQTSCSILVKCVVQPEQKHVVDNNTQTDKQLQEILVENHSEKRTTSSRGELNEYRPNKCGKNRKDFGVQTNAVVYIAESNSQNNNNATEQNPTLSNNSQFSHTRIEEEAVASENVESVCSEPQLFDNCDGHSSGEDTLKFLEKKQERCNALEKQVRERDEKIKTKEQQILELEKALKQREELSSNHEKHNAHANESTTRETKMIDKETKTNKKEVTTKRQQTDVVQHEQKSTQSEEHVPIDSSPTHSRLAAMNERLEVEITYERNRNDFLEERRMKLQGEKAKMQREMQTLRHEISRLQSENSKIQNQIEEAFSKIEKQNSESLSLNQDIAKLQDENKVLKCKLSPENSKMAIQENFEYNHDSTSQAELLESRLQAIEHRFVTCVIDPLIEAKVYKKEEVIRIDKFSTWEKIKEDLTEALRERGRLASEKLSLVMAWKKLNRDYLEMTRQLNEKRLTTTDHVEKFQVISEVTPVDTQLMKEFQELKQEQKDMRRKIKEDTEQVHLLKEQSQELFSRVGGIVCQATKHKENQSLHDTFGENTSHTEGLLEFNFNFGATFRSSFQTSSYENPSYLNPNFPQMNSHRSNEDGNMFGENGLHGRESHYLPCIGDCQQVISDMSDEFEEDLKDVMVELVRKNRQVFKMEEEIDRLNAKLRSKSFDYKPDKSILEGNSKELEKLKRENKTLSEQNEELNRTIKENVTFKEKVDERISRLEREKEELEKELEKLKQSHKTNLEELEKATESIDKLSKQKEELAVGIVLRDKKITLYEKELKELQNKKTQNSEKGEENLENGVDNGSDDQPRDELREAQHKAASVEAELEQLQASMITQQEEMENKWAKRLRKECSELQAELAEKYAQDKRSWQKKEADLQNMIRQMKVLLDKRAKEVQTLKKKLANTEEIPRTPPNKSVTVSTPSPTQEPREENHQAENNTELSSSKHSDHVSTTSLDSSSMSDDMVDGLSVNTVDTGQESSKPNNKKDDDGSSDDDDDDDENDDNMVDDGLSDRDLRRVAYKLTNEEWTQLGSFLGVSDSELQTIVGLSMGSQEKAFRLLCLWNTRSTLGKNQLVSQLAIALEEINRKDVALFVVEQMMTGKPRKKFFGWRK